VSYLPFLVSTSEGYAHHMRPDRRTVAVGTFLLCLTTPVLAQECPPSTYRCGYGSDFSTTAARDSASCWFEDGSGSGEILVDHRQGIAWVYARGGDTGADVRLRATDDFRVTGLAPGTPLTLAAHLSSQMAVDINRRFFYGKVVVRLIESASNQVSDSLDQSCGLSCPEPVRRESDLSIVIATTSDQVFRLEYSVECSLYWGNTSAYETLSFSGLPPGAMITSCKGFQQDAPTLALPVSWGVLKIRYR